MTHVIYSVNELKMKLESFFKTTPVDKAILFGSYAKGAQTPSSDVDIVIDCKGMLRGIDFFGILEDLTMLLDKPVDLIESSEIIDGGRVQREIEETGVLIYERI